MVEIQEKDFFLEILEPMKKEQIGGGGQNLIFLYDPNDVPWLSRSYRMVKDLFKQKINGKLKKCERCSPDSFYKSQWQINDGKLSPTYLAYKLIHAFAFVTILILSVIDIGKKEDEKDLYYYLKWPIYLTNWSLFANTLQACVAVYFLSQVFVASNGQKEDLSGFKMRLCIKIYWILHTISLSVSVGVTTVYWLFVYDPAIHVLDASNYLVHVANSVLMISDFFIVGHPHKFSHCLYPAVFVIVYSLFNWIYAVLGGKDRLGRDFIYGVMNWSNPVKCIIFVTGGVALVITVHTILWLLFLLKKGVFAKLRNRERQIKLKYESEMTDVRINLPV